MNLVADEGVDAPIIEALRAAGHDVYYVAEELPGLTDPEVLEQAVQRGAVRILARFWEWRLGRLLRRKWALVAVGVVVVLVVVLASITSSRTAR